MMVVVRFPTGSLGSANEWAGLFWYASFAHVVRLISFPYRYVSSADGRAGGRPRPVIIGGAILVDRSDRFREKLPACAAHACAYSLRGVELMQCGLTCVGRSPRFHLIRFYRTTKPFPLVAALVTQNRYFAASLLESVNTV